MERLIPDISIVIITRNEASNIKACLESVTGLGELVVVDAQSSDETVRYARDYAAQIYSRPFMDFASQKNFAVQKASGRWIFSIDADETIDTSLRDEIVKAAVSGAYNAYAIKRRNVILGRELRFGGNGADYPVRLFKKDKAQFTGDVHECLTVDGTVGTIAGGCILHRSTPDAASYFKKLGLYTDLEANLIRQKISKPQAIILATLKPPYVFIKRYVFQIGFLDGWRGLVFYALSAYYEFLKYLKVVRA